MLPNTQIKFTKLNLPKPTNKANNIYQHNTKQILNKQINISICIPAGFLMRVFGVNK